ncbi:MAG: guanitoxin biosynthesis pre-guanitoxin forming N-methyltransferase GntF [Proteobacteria bacterium]|nr:guanitoxin biosynthesis pre-guanitoxin forming N-methyltransferase GntF [Pseudomonadota bacterium]
MSDFADYGGFSPLEYLRAFYSEIDSESEGLLQFLVSVFDSAPHAPLVLEFGSGPVLISAIPAARRARAIHYCDFVPANREYLTRWLAGEDAEFDWSPYIARCLELEGKVVSEKAIRQRAHNIRDLVRRVVSCNIFDPLPIRTRYQYEVIISNYCLDAVTTSKQEWQLFTRRLAKLLKPGGTLVLSSLRKTEFFEFGTSRYANVVLDVDDLADAFTQAGFDPQSIRVESTHCEQDYCNKQGVIFAAASLPLVVGNNPWHEDNGQSSATVSRELLSTGASPWIDLTTTSHTRA